MSEQEKNQKRKKHQLEFKPDEVFTPQPNVSVEQLDREVAQLKAQHGQAGTRNIFGGNGDHADPIWPGRFEVIIPQSMLDSIYKSEMEHWIEAIDKMTQDMVNRLKEPFQIPEWTFRLNDMKRKFKKE